MSNVDKIMALPAPKKLYVYGAATIGVWLFSGLFQIANGWWLLDNLGRPLVSNFLCIWASGQMALSGQAAASYDWHSIGGIESAAVAQQFFTMPWLYPPTFLLAAASLGLLPYLWSCIAWLLLTGIGYVAVMRAILPSRLAVVLAIAAPPAFLNLISTETGFAVAALTGLALLLLETRPILAGVALGFLTFKPQLGLLFPLVLIVTGQWRAFFSAAAATLLLAVLTTVLFGADVWGAYLQAGQTIGATALGDRSTLFGTYVKWPDIQTWYSVARYLGAGTVAAWTVYAVTAGGVAVAVCWLWRKPIHYNLKAAALAAGSFLVTPYVMTHDTVILVVAVAFLVKESLATGFRRGDIEVFALMLVAPLYPLFASGIVPLLPVVYSALLVWIVLRARALEIGLNPDTGLAARMS